MNHIVRTVWLLCGSLLFLGCWTTAHAQFRLVNQNQVQFDENQFDSWVFSDIGSAAEARKRATNNLSSQIHQIDRVATLSDTQRQKLELAGQVDQERFFERLSAAKRGIKFGMITQNEMNNLWQVTQPLQLRFSRGLFGPGSMFHKTVRTALQPEQLVKYDELQAARKKEQHRLAVQAAVTTLETSLPMTRVQREKLKELLLTHSQPFESGNQRYYEIMLVLGQMKKIPETELRPLFSPQEWKVLVATMQQAAQYDQILEQQGLLGVADD